MNFILMLNRNSLCPSIGQSSWKARGNSFDQAQVTCYGTLQRLICYRLGPCSITGGGETLKKWNLVEGSDRLHPGRRYWNLSLSSSSPFSSWPSGCEQHCSTTQSCHDILSGHRSQATELRDHGLQPLEL